MSANDARCLALQARHKPCGTARNEGATGGAQCSASGGHGGGLTRRYAAALHTATIRLAQHPPSSPFCVRKRRTLSGVASTPPCRRPCCTTAPVPAPTPPRRRAAAPPQNVARMSRHKGGASGRRACGGHDRGSDSCGSRFESCTKRQSKRPNERDIVATRGAHTGTVWSFSCFYQHAVVSTMMLSMLLY